MMPFLVDSHYHLDFLRPASLRLLFLQELEKRKVGILAQTLLPGDFLRERSALSESEGRGPSKHLLALGFHPWWIPGEEERQRALLQFQEGLPLTPYIGEIGLDFSPRRKAQAEEAVQVVLLRRELFAMKRVGRRSVQGRDWVLSLHVVRAADPLLALLEEAKKDLSFFPIFHHFTGTSDQLTRLIRLGGGISIHPRMLATKKGRAYVCQVPGDRLLLETDLPKQEMEDRDRVPHAVLEREAAELADKHRQTLEELVAGIEALRGGNFMQQLQENQRRIFGENLGSR